MLLSKATDILSTICYLRKGPFSPMATYQGPTNATLHLTHSILCSGRAAQYRRRVGSWAWLEEQLISKYNKELTFTHLWYNPSKKIRLKNPVLKFSREIVIVLQRLSFNGDSLPSCPLWQTPLCVVVGKTLKDGSWQQHNINQVGQIVGNGKMITFNNLNTQFGLTDFNVLTYNQIYSITKSL